MLKKSILPMSCGVLVMVMSGLLDAAEITLISHKTLGSQLRDGMKLATGRIACREPHDGFHIWINASQNGKVGHYIVQNNRETKHELKVKIGGGGWSSSLIEGQRGVYRQGEEKQAIFDIMSDGNQYSAPGEYIFSVSGECLISRG
ncbi:TPA: aggregative adherence fimbria I minor subunit AggB [Escherichia coli]|uniref:Protein AggB n=1 Tax=Escherichia coli TaxID=562 RepID=AGGB_ECOLX|nr:aggregative adherence fimbria I minor subunit AggB [Escherichia coli]P46006.1 RecName: Full=Protein AggB; Flags: Precursor [Escherichia coli]HDR9914482.1 aggregative adherence fimbria I minor subunit AggB [Escherichia coli 92.0144 (F03)]AAA57453.1 unknown [Escherichia coli]EEV7142231.1 aggregative adherence fimbria I minor subunit AggB [Escherichia coli]EEY5336394.1 aggregative adherence fimbria I minor subunit AggB [Escherichia coli]EFA5209178.1 aggregative adherence fimbria I minor subun